MVCIPKYRVNVDWLKLCADYAVATPLAASH